MEARQFYNMVVKDYEKLPCTRNRQNKAYYEEIIDREIERVEEIKRNEAEK